MGMATVVSWEILSGQNAPWEKGESLHSRFNFQRGGTHDQACGHAPILRLNVQPWVRSLSTVPISIIMSKENKMQLKGGNKYMEKQKGRGAKKSSKLTKAFFRNASMQLAKGHSLLKIILVSSCPHTAKDSVYPHVYKTSTFYLQRPHLSY